MKSVKGKKLLVLGGTKLMEVIVNKAKKMGVYTIVVDNRPLDASPVKLLADTYYDIDFSDYDRIESLVRELGIDGVMTGFSDADLWKYLAIAKRCNLPCYGDEHQFRIATDKSAFKKACVDAGVPVIPGTTVCNFDEVLVFAKSTGFPLMLKPIDNSGSRGVIKCERQEELEHAYQYALSYSDAKQVIVEKYLDCDNIAVSYFAADGVIRLSTTDDRKMYISPETGSSISCYSEYPSEYTRRYIDEVNDKVIEMLTKNGFRNGMISLQAFVDKQSFYFCEMCYRLSGGQHYLLTENQNGIDELGLLIRFAVLGSCLDAWDEKRENPDFSENCAMLRILGVPEKEIARLDGFAELAEDKRVFKAYSAKHVGNTVGKDGTTGQVIGNVLYKFQKDEDREKVAKEMLDRLTIEDKDGNSIAWITLG